MAVSPELPVHLREMREQHRLTFDLLHDPGQDVAGRYGLVYTFPQDLQQVYADFDLDLPTLNGDGAWRLPMPARDPW